jgi:hypothetical protein
VDDQTLAEQLAKTGDIMDLCCNEAWVREGAQIEAECDGQIEAGLALKDYAAAKYDDAHNDVRQVLRQQMRLQSILFSELRLWMEEWEIGISFEETYTVARQLVRSHLKNPSSNLNDWLEALLAEDRQTSVMAVRPVRTQTRERLSLMLTNDDWQRLAQVAADAAANIVSASVLKVGKGDQHPSAAA